MQVQKGGRIQSGKEIELEENWKYHVENPDAVGELLVEIEVEMDDRCSVVLCR